MRNNKENSNENKSTSKLLIADNIRKLYGEGDKKQEVLHQVSLTVEQGEFISIMGPSGSGKSTLMYSLSGMDHIDGGEVSFDGYQFSTLKERELSDMRRNKMGFIFQQPTFLKNLNIVDNIVLPSIASDKKKRVAILERAQQLMQQVGIEELKERDITQVSGGQLQRAGICRALMTNPKIIFGDEPTGALHSKATQEIMDLLSDINKEGTTILLVTHDAKVAAKTKRVLFMKDGEIVSNHKFDTTPFTSYEDRVIMVAEKMQEIGI